MIKKSNKKLSFVSLFSGGGGFSIGFKELGFECLCSSDINDDAENTHLLNWPEIPFITKSATQLLPEEILAATNNIKPDVIIGGPPCQGFSIMGDKHASDPRNLLFSTYVNIVRELKPKCFVFENVVFRKSQIPNSIVPNSRGDTITNNALLHLVN